MPVQPFGKADPQYDALRVLSHQSIDPGPGDGSTSPSGGLENKIYVWHADGSTIDTFDPDETGLNAALAGAASGDTVWLPSIPIALTAAVTVPAEVSVKGLSHKSILNFSGFSDPCMVLSAGSIIQDMTVNHTDGKWFSATASGSKALRIHGTAQRATIGTPTPAEPWLATNDDIFWLNRMTNVWNKITPGLGTQKNFYIRADGSMAFLYIAGVGWYKGTSLKTSPSWTQIASHTGNILRHGSCDGTNFYMVEVVVYDDRSWKHGTYNGTSWSYGGTFVVNWFSPDVTAKDFSVLWDVAKSSGATTIETGVLDYRGATYDINDGWVNASSGKRYAWGKDGSGHIQLRTPGVGNILDAGAALSPDRCTVRGAISGAHTFAIDFNGKLYYSTNGTSFSNVATWVQGYANDTVNAGGGELFWFPYELTSGVTTPLRLYETSGWSSSDLTYNFWSVASPTNKEVVGVGTVYS